MFEIKGKSVRIQRPSLNWIAMVGLLVGLMVFTIPVSAQSGDKGWSKNPNTPVASDGKSYGGDPDKEGYENLQGESAFEGTGEVGPGIRETESAEEYAKILGLEPATGEVGTESIIGPDNRVLVNPTTSYPARAVALITFTGGRCTGWLYGKDIVATAGHCVHSGGSNGSWKSNVRVYPGRNGASSPYGYCTARRLHSVTGWTNNKDERYDYGAIKLNCSIGNSTGWFGYWWQSASLTGIRSIINGYPGDKPLTQWKSTDKIRVTESRQVFYQNDTTAGMSGGPVYDNRASGSSFCAGYCSMAIHAYGLHGSSPHNANNHGTRIVQPVFNNMKAWKDAS